jgi:hypothetical protein
MGLLELILFGLGLGLAGAKQVEFEKAAAADIKGRLQGEQAVVSVRADLDGSRLGSITTAEILARDFSLEGLPLFTEPERSQKGRIRHLKMTLSDFMLRGLKVTELKADIPDCRFDLDLALKEKELRLSKSGIGEGYVKIQQDDLAKWIVAKYAEIKTCTVDASKGTVLVSGYGEFLIVKTNFKVLAKLTAVDGTKLMLSDARIWFDGMRADPFAAETLLKTLNPVVDLNKDLGLYDAVQVEKIDARNGFVTASGKTKIPIRPETDPALPPKS